MTRKELFADFREDIRELLDDENIDTPSKLLGLLHAAADATIDLWILPNQRAEARAAFSKWKPES